MISPEKAALLLAPNPGPSAATQRLLDTYLPLEATRHPAMLATVWRDPQGRIVKIVADGFEET